MLDKYFKQTLSAGISIYRKTWWKRNIYKYLARSESLLNYHLPAKVHKRFHLLTGTSKCTSFTTWKPHIYISNKKSKTPLKQYLICPLIFLPRNRLFQLYCENKLSMKWSLCKFSNCSIHTCCVYISAVLVYSVYSTAITVLASNHRWMKSEEVLHKWNTTVP